MERKDIRIQSRDGGDFDCYLVVPEGDEAVPAVVIASAVHGVDGDMRQIADELASQGYIVAAPDLFWRSIPGPLPRDDDRSRERSQPRLPKIKAGEQDMSDTLAELRKLPRFNGRALAMGFCYGGPYAVIGPSRLGYAAGVSCHGTQLKDFIGELEGLTRPVCMVWGDQDFAAPPPVREAYLNMAERMPNLQVHIFPGVQHGFMMRENKKAFDQKTRDFTMARTLELLASLRGPAGAHASPSVAAARTA